MRLLSILLISFFTISSHAVAYMDMGIVAGYRSNDGDAVTSGNDVNGGSGLVLGGTAYVPITEMIRLRTGFLYTQRYYTVESTLTETDIELAYVDIPLTAMLMFSDFGGAFAGINLGLNAGDDCGASSCQDVENTITPIQIGGFFKIGPQIGLEVFYETLSGKIMAEIEDTTAVGASVVFTLE